jgi:hypothetical protein
MFYKNSFTVLREEDEEVVFTKNFKRKVLKKLREIDALKKKEILNSSELEKLGKENYWKSILNPNIKQKKKKEINPELKKKQYARYLRKEENKRRKKIKMRKRIEKQKKLAKERKEKEIREKIEMEKICKEKEAEDKKRKERRRLKCLRKKLRETRNDNQIKREFLQKIIEGMAIDKVFRKMSLTYHPDKNNNKEWAKSMQQKLIDIRDEINVLQ